MYNSIQKLKAAKFYLDYQNVNSGQVECNRLATDLGDRIVEMAIERGFKNIKEAPRRNISRSPE